MRLQLEQNKLYKIVRSYSEFALLSVMIKCQINNIIEKVAIQKNSSKDPPRSIQCFTQKIFT